MEYTLSLTRHAAETLMAHLLSDRSCEQMAITLCGINRLHRELRLLARDVILLPPDAFRRQDAAGLELKPEVQAFIHRRAHAHGLIQVDWHSHPGSGRSLSFSGTDDRYEAAQAAYLAHRMGGIPYGSVVVNDDAMDARIWLSARRTQQQNGRDVILYRPKDHPLKAVLTGDLAWRIPLSAQRQTNEPALSAVFDRQVRAFGETFQRKLHRLRVGVAGAGGLGSALVDLLARLGVNDWVLVDPDVVELTNLNRLVNATLTDARKSRPKVNVARSTIYQSNPKARVRALQATIFDPDAQTALKTCDFLIAATDNHSSRMALNRLAVQYLIPVMHVGFNIDVGEAEGGGERPVTDVSGEFAIADLGCWCLQCAGIVNTQQAGWELGSSRQRAIMQSRGYVDGTPAPAVRHLDSLVASLAAAEFHNLVHPFKPTTRYLTYDVLNGQSMPLDVTPSHDCPVCSPDHGVLGLGDLEPLPDYRRGKAIALPAPHEAREKTAAVKPAAQPGDPVPATTAPPLTQSAAPSPLPASTGRHTLVRRRNTPGEAAQT